MAVLQLSMPKATADAVKSQAKAQGLTASEFARRAFDSYLTTQRESLARLQVLEAQAKTARVGG